MTETELRAMAERLTQDIEATNWQAHANVAYAALVAVRIATREEDAKVAEAQALIDLRESREVEGDDTENDSTETLELRASARALKNLAASLRALAEKEKA